MNYLVTGGSGFIGCALVERLVEGGHTVRVLDDNSRGSAKRLEKVMDRIEFVEGDIRDPAAVESACQGIERVVHLAFVNGTEFFYSKPELVLEVGVKGMMNVLDACKTHGIKEIFLASSNEVYQTPPEIPTKEDAPFSVPDPLNPRYSYGGGKIISELLTLNYGRKFFSRAVVFRPFNVYGPDMGWEHVIPQFIVRMKQLTEGTEGTVKFPIQGSGKEARAFTYIDDFVDGLMIVLEKGKHMGIYHIGSMDEIAIADVARTVGSCFGREVEIVPGELKKGGTLRRCPDTTKVQALGFLPKVSLKEGLKRTVEWYTEHADEDTHKG